MKIKLFILSAALVLITSCSNDDTDTVILTVDDAAEFVAASMALSTYGAVNNMNYVSEQIVDLLDCGESQSATRTESETSPNGEVMTSFTISESYALTCEGSTEEISYSFSSDQTTDSFRLDTDHGIDGNWIIEGV